MSLDRIDLFRISTRVVEAASFTRSADTLAMPRSFISATVTEFESCVGAVFFTARRVGGPTHDGAVFYERCLRVIAEVEATESLFRRETAKPSGRLRADDRSRRAARQRRWQACMRAQAPHRCRHNGLLLAVHVLPANIQDGHGTVVALLTALRRRFPRLRHVFAYRF